MLAAATTFATGNPPQEHQASRGANVVAPLPEHSGAPTDGELSRTMEARRRALEELTLGIGDAEPTSEQCEQVRALEAQIADLRAQCELIRQSQTATRDDDSLAARWIRFRSAFRDITTWDLRDGMFRFQIGIRLQIDGTLGLQETALKRSVGAMDNGLELRRGRVFAEGRVLRALDFRVEYDLGADAGIKNAYLEGRQISEWVAHRFRWRVGQFQEPFGLARTTSSPYDGFMEIGLPADTLAPGHNSGLMLRHAGNSDRITWAASLTTNGRTTHDNPNNSRLTVTGRVTGLPLLSDDGLNLVHLGASFSDRQPTDGSIQYRARPEARFAPFYADTGLITSDDVKLFGVEWAVVNGSSWLQAEWIRSDVDATPAGNPRFSGMYLEAGRFLTGERRVYDQVGGAFGRLEPNNVYRGGNPLRTVHRGAFELTGRYSVIDLTDEQISGGEIRDLSFGLNWYVNDVSRVMLNYVRSELHGVGRSSSILLRFQYNP